MEHSDGELLERWITQRDAEAFKHITDRYATMVYATCRRILRNDADAEDAAQDCFRALIQAGRKPGTYLGPWLHRVATNTAISRLRSESRRIQREREHPNVGDEKNSTDDELFALIDVSIAELPEKLRAPLVAYYFEGKTYDVIAESLGLTRQGASYRVQKAVEEVRARLNRQGIRASSVAITGALVSSAEAEVPASLTATLGKLALGGAHTVTASKAASIAMWMSLKTKGVLAAGLIAVVAALVVLGTHPTPVPPSLDPRPAPIGSDTLADADVNQGTNPVATESTQASESSANESDSEFAINESQANQPAIDASTTEEDKEPFSPVVFGVVSDSGGFPIANATVSVVMSGLTHGIFDHGDEGVTKTLTTNDLGQFEVRGFESSSMYLSANAKGYASAVKRITFSDEKLEYEVRLTLEEGVDLEGIVLTQSQEPIEGAVVAMLGYANSRGSGTGGSVQNGVAITDERGRFRIGYRVAGGTALKVSSRTHGEKVFANLPAGSGTPVTLVLDDAPSLQGRITDQHGVPAKNMRIELDGQFTLVWTVDAGHDPRIVTGAADTRVVTTDDDGRYAFPTLTSGVSYRVQVETPQYQSASKLFDLGVLQPGEDRVWDHQLQPTIRVTGTVLGDKTGKPIRDVQIAYMRDDESFIAARPDETGEYALHLFDPGTYIVYPEYNTWSREMMIERYGVEIDVVTGNHYQHDFELPEPFTLSIQVVDPEEKPIAGAMADWFRVTPKGRGIYGMGATDSNGRYAHDFLPELESGFFVHKEGYTSLHTDRIVGESGAVYPEQTVILYPTGGIDGRLLDSSGRPLAHRQVKVALRAEGVRVHHEQFREWDTLEDQTDGDGNFAIGNGFPAIRGDVHLQYRDNANTWHHFGIVRNVEVAEGYVTSIGDVRMSPD